MKRKALVGSLWGGGDLLMRQALQFVITLVLARLLTPADFGAVAMLSLFVALASLLADAGFGLALIQRHDTDAIDESSVFWLNLALGGVLSLAIFLCASFIAEFYDVPVLEPLARLLAVTPLLSATSAVHVAILTRKLDFRTQARANAVGTVLAGSIAIAMAFRGGGVWALAAFSVLAVALTSTLLWMTHAWRPAPVFSLASLRKLAGFGGYALGANVLDVAYSRLYTIVAGRLFGTQALGQYAQAENLRQMPATFLGGLVSRVVLPVLSQATDSGQVLRGTQVLVRVLMLLHVPVMLAIAALAEPLVLAIFGSKWAPAIPILRVLALAGVLYPLHLVNVQALLALGRSGLVLQLELVKKAIGIALLALGAQYGLLGIAWSQVAFSILVLAINARYTHRWFGYGAIRQLGDAMVPLLVGALVAGGLYWASLKLQASPWAVLLALGSLGAAAYLGIMAMLRGAAWREIEQLRHMAETPLADQSR